MSVVTVIAYLWPCLLSVSHVYLFVENGNKILERREKEREDSAGFLRNKKSAALLLKPDTFSTAESSHMHARTKILTLKLLS